MAARIACSFNCQVLPPRCLDVLSVSGEEGLSRCYRYLVSVRTDHRAIVETPLVGSRATLIIDPHGAVKTVHGVVTAAEIRAEPGRARLRCDFVLEPRLAQLSRTVRLAMLNARSDLPMATIVEAVLRGRPVESDRGAIPDVAPLFPVRIALRDYYGRARPAVQYEENDLEFVERLLQRAGVFYFFEQSLEDERLVVADSNAVMDQTMHCDWCGPEPSDTNDPVIDGFWTRRRLGPKWVQVRDPVRPGLPVWGRAEVDPEGSGVINLQEWPDLLELPGEIVARRRAEALRVDLMGYEGETKWPGLIAGSVMTLRDHPVAVYNRPYAVTRIRHDWSTDPDSGELGGRYSATFRCIDWQMPYRPPVPEPRPLMAPIPAWPSREEGLFDLAAAGGEGVQPFHLPVSSPAAILVRHGAPPTIVSQKTGQREVSREGAGPVSSVPTPIIQSKGVAGFRLVADQEEGPAWRGVALDAWRALNDAAARSGEVSMLLDPEGIELRVGPTSRLRLDSAGLTVDAPLIRLMGSEIVAGGRMTLDGTVSLAGDLTVTGRASLVGAIGMSGDVSVSGTLGCDDFTASSIFSDSVATGDIDARDIAARHGLFVSVARKQGPDGAAD